MGSSGSDRWTISGREGIEVPSPAVAGRFALACLSATSLRVAPAGGSGRDPADRTGRQPPSRRQTQSSKSRHTSTGRPSASSGESSRGSNQSLLDQLGVPKPKSWGLLCLRTSLAVVFFWSGFTKLWPASAETVLITTSTDFLPQPEIVVFVGFLEALVGLLLLYRPLLRIATLLAIVQTVGSQTILLFTRNGVPAEGIPGAWAVFPVVPSELGLYVLKNYVLLTAMIVVAIGYTGSQLRQPPLARLKSATARQCSVLVYRAIGEWLPRNALTFLRMTLLFSLVGGGMLTMAGHGAPLEGVRAALATLDVQLADSSLSFVVGGLQAWAGILLLSNEQSHLELAVLLTAAYVVLGLLPIGLAPEAAFYEEYIWLSPAFPSLYFLKDLVVLGGVWTIRDAKVPWQPAKGLYLLQDAIEVLLAWLGIGARNAPEPADTDELRRYRE